MRLELSSEGRYALRALVYLAWSGEQMTAARISSEARVPRRLLARIMAKLSRSGLVETEQGRGGGCRLARPAGEITLREAVEAVEGPFGVFHCIMENRACGERAPCVLHDAWEEGLSAILEYLGAQTLDEFVAGTASGKLFSQTLPEDRPRRPGCTSALARQSATKLYYFLASVFEEGRACPTWVYWRWLVERGSGRRELLVSKGWVQAVALVVLFGFFVLGLLAYRTYSGQPPIPDRVVDPQGDVVFTGEDVRAGQEVFLRNGLMQYGSIFGHGAYLGPDFTADYLRRSALSVRESYGGEGSDRAAVQTVSDFKENRYDPETRTLKFTAPQAAAFDELRGHYGRYFGESTTRYGLRPEAKSDPEDIRQLTAYFAWTAWAASALRPGTDYTYTNNWPLEPLVENEPTANVVVWSVLSLIVLLGGIGLLFAAFGRWNFLGWRGREQATLSFRNPGDVALTPAQRACAWFFLVMAALFLLQTMVGAASQHYRADLASFFGIDLAQFLPYNLMRTWHVQLAIFWVTTSFLAAGIFLAR